jgi:kynurenine formamidase
MKVFYTVVLLLAAAALDSALRAPAQAPSNLITAYDVIRSHRFIDLTHAFEPGIPHWPGFPDERVKTIYWYTPRKGTLGSGFYAQEFCHVGQWGTHVDAPAHFAAGGRTVDQIDPKQMLLPLVVLDVHQKVAANPDTRSPWTTCAHGNARMAQYRMEPS